MMTERIFAHKHHPEQGIRAGLGILRLARRYGPARLEAACERGLAFGVKSYGRVASILDRNLDRRPSASDGAEVRPLGAHENLRGRKYYN